MDDNNIFAVVLAGGKSKRFGEDKNQAKLGNITLLEHVLAKVTKKFKKTLIISNQNLNIKKLNSITIVPDCIQGNLGPLVGVLTAMKWIKKNNKQYKKIYNYTINLAEEQAEKVMYQLFFFRHIHQMMKFF